MTLAFDPLLCTAVGCKHIYHACISHPLCRLQNDFSLSCFSLLSERCTSPPGSLSGGRCQQLSLLSSNLRFPTPVFSLRRPLVAVFASDFDILGFVFAEVCGRGLRSRPYHELAPSILVPLVLVRQFVWQLTSTIPSTSLPPSLLLFLVPL